MHWIEGDYWKAPIAASQLESSFDYKYFVQKFDRSGTRICESKGNQQFDLLIIEKTLRQPEHIEAIKAIDKYHFKIEDLNLIYIKDKEYLIVTDTWH